MNEAVPDEVVEAAKQAVANSSLAHDYTGSPTDFHTDLRTAITAALTVLIDPIESGQEAALAQWEERWRMLHAYLNDAMENDVDGIEVVLVKRVMEAIAERLPTGKPVDLPHSEVMRRTAELLGFEPDNHHNAFRCPYCNPASRILIQLEPERVKRLLEVLRSAGAHPSGLGSYEAANDANALADDIELMTQ